MLLVQHHVGVCGIVVHAGVEFGFRTTVEGVADALVSAYPVAQFKYGGLVGGEIDEGMAGENRQHIEIVGESPVHGVGAYLGG